MNRAELVDLLSRCVETRSPSGREEEMRDLVAGELRRDGIAYEIDRVGNVVVRFDGTVPGLPSTMLVGHIDEVAMAVKRVTPDGKLHLTPIGGVVPFKFGEGPVDVLGRHTVVTGVLSWGSVHATDDSGERFGEAFTGTAEIAKWKNWWVETKLTPQQLADAGVQPGTPITPTHARKKAALIGTDYLSGYALDDKASVPVLLELARRLDADAPPGAVTLAFSTREEVGCHGALWLTRQELPDICIAVEVAPIMPEYGPQPDEDPVVWCQDALGLTDARLVGALQDAAGRRGIRTSTMVSEIGGSDASWSTRLGYSAMSSTVSAPVHNTHGWELMNMTALERLLEVLDEFVRQNDWL